MKRGRTREEESENTPAFILGSISHVYCIRWTIRAIRPCGSPAAGRLTSVRWLLERRAGRSGTEISLSCVKVNHVPSATSQRLQLFRRMLYNLNMTTCYTGNVSFTSAWEESVGSGFAIPQRLEVKHGSNLQHR